MATKMQGKKDGLLLSRKRVRPPPDNVHSHQQQEPRSLQGQTTDRKRERERKEAAGMESGLDLELTRGIGLKKIGAGLVNLGNTCFLNSVLQCLTYTEPLAAYLQSGRHKIVCRASGFCAMCAIQNHVMNALASSGKILAPSHLVKNLRCISRSFRLSRQEDAHEYMVMLMDSMHRCCLPSGIASESPSAYEKSLVHKIFGGRLRSQVKCRQCSYYSNTYEPFLDLSLEIVQSDSLLKALAHFTAVEQLEGGEKVYGCEQCKVKVQAVKQFTVEKVAYILAIHLKRFNPLGGKINKKVEFGRTLNMKPFVSGPHEGDLKYTLYGVLVHAGWSTHSGHYYCFIRTSTGIWHALDDNRVYQVSEQVVLEQKAYMLFYVRDKRSINQPSAKYEHQGSEPKHNKPILTNVVLKGENHLLASSACAAIPKRASCSNSNDAAVPAEKASLPRKETLLDGDSALDRIEARQNTKLASLAGEQHVSIVSLSRLPSNTNSDQSKTDNEGTKHATRNEPQGAASIGNVGISDSAAADDGNMYKDLVNVTTDNGETTSTHLENAVADDGHKIIKCLGNDDMINHTDSNGDSAAKKFMGGDKFIHAVANGHQVSEAPSEVHINHHVTIRESNDEQGSNSGDVSLIPQNHGNGSALFSNMEDCNCLQRKQDSNCRLHKKRVKLQKHVGHLKLIMPLSRRYLLLTAFNISRKKSSFKRKNRFHLNSRSLSCNNSAGRFVKSVTGSAAVRPSTLGREYANIVPNHISNFCRPKKNHEWIVPAGQNGSGFTKTEKTNFETHLHVGSAQSGFRPICTQNGDCKAGELIEKAENLCTETPMGRSNYLAAPCNGDIKPYSGANKKEFSVISHSVQNGDASTCSLRIHEKRTLVSSSLNTASSNFRDICEKDGARVDENAILQQTCLEFDGTVIDRVPYEKEITIGYLVDEWTEEYDSTKKKKAKTSVSENVMIYGDQRHIDDCSNHFQAIVCSKVEMRNSRGNNIAARNKPARI